MLKYFIIQYKFLYYIKIYNNDGGDENKGDNNNESQMCNTNTVCFHFMCVQMYHIQEDNMSVSTHLFELPAQYILKSLKGYFISHLQVQLDP
jgi:hypothetical protein